MAEKNSIVILSGPVGAGKTTVARQVTALSAEPIVHIEGDQFWFFIAKSDKGQTRINNFKTIMRSMTAAAVPFALSGYRVILDFSIPPWFLATAKAIVKRRGIHLEYVVLRPDENICAKRAAARIKGVITDYNPYHDLYLAFDEVQQHIIYDNTGSPAAIAAKVWEGINEGAFMLH